MTIDDLPHLSPFPLSTDCFQYTAQPAKGIGYWLFSTMHKKESFPDTAGQPQLAVPILGMDLIRQTDAARQQTLFFWHGQQVKMIVHQAVCPDLQSMFPIALMDKYFIIPVWLCRGSIL